MHPSLKVVLFAAASFGILLVLSKLLGKKQISQLDFVDYVVGISIGSIAAEMATETERPIYFYIIGMVMFFALDILVTFLGRKGAFLKSLLKGKPIVLIYEGKLLPKNLKKSKLDVNDLLVLLRAKDYFDISKVSYALFETNGTLSVVPIGQERPAVTRDLPVPVEEASMPNYLVVDGKISGSGLSEIQKDKAWLFSRLKIKDPKQLKKILLASYDSQNDSIIINHQN